MYVYDFGDDWRHDIVVERIIPATPGVRYRRCTAGHGAEDAAEDGPPPLPPVDDVDPEVETEMLKHLAQVLVPES